MMRRRISVALIFIGAGVGFGIGAGIVVACGLVLLAVLDSPEPAARQVPASCRSVSV